MNLERRLRKKRVLIGYNPKEVRKKLQSLQEQHEREQENLQQAITAEKEKNKMLLAKLGEIDKQPSQNTVAEEVTAILKEQFFAQTYSIMEIKNELEEHERMLREKLAEKIQQKEWAQKRIQDVLHYLSSQKTELEKGLVK